MIIPFCGRDWIFKTYVALAADGLVAVVLGGKGLQGGLDDTTTETEDKVKGGLLQENNRQHCFIPTPAIIRLIDNIPPQLGAIKTVAIPDLSLKGKNIVRFVPSECCSR
jgi:hypothetical protein